MDLYPFVCSIVIDGIYEALSNFGFEGGNILEPAMGVGNFFGRMPEDMRADSKLYGVEIDSISGRIAQKLYPDADIAVKGFEKNNFQNGCFVIQFVLFLVTEFYHALPVKQHFPHHQGEVRLFPYGNSL